MEDCYKNKYGIKEIKVKNNMITVDLMTHNRSRCDQMDMGLKYIGTVESVYK